MLRGGELAMDWEDRLDNWEVELELNAQLESSDWTTLERAAADTGVSRAALRSWYRTGQIPSRLVDGPHGPQRLVPVAVVAARAEASPRLRRAGERRLAEQAQLEILLHRVDQLELRLAALERRRAERDLQVLPDRIPSAQKVSCLSGDARRKWCLVTGCQDVSARPYTTRSFLPRPIANSGGKPHG
jgi:transposase